jgi:hypothetical protein
MALKPGIRIKMFIMPVLWHLLEYNYAHVIALLKETEHNKAWRVLS